MDEQKIQEAVEFYEAFKEKKTRQSVNEAFRRQVDENTQRRVDRNPRLGNFYQSMQSGMTKSAEEYRARKEQEERERTRKQMEKQAETRAKTEQSSGWLWDAVKRKRGK